MERPNNILSSVQDDSVLAYIEHLEEQQTLLNQNSDAKLFVSISRKVKDINTQIQDIKLEYEEDELGNNKNFKNFQKFDNLVEMAKKTAQTLDFFKTRTTTEEIEKEEKFIDTPVERHVFRRIKEQREENQRREI